MAKIEELTDKGQTGANGKLSDWQTRVQKNAPQNRMALMIERVHFEPSDNSKIYKNNDGSQQRKLATAVCVLNGGAFAIRGQINAKQNMGGKTRAEFSIPGSRTSGKSFVALDERARVELESLATEIESYYADWRKVNGVKDVAPRGVTLDDVSFE